MKLLDKIKSQTDNTIKYIFQTYDNLIIEMAYINKEDGKNIICVPSQTSCKMKCKFCHITDASDKLVYRNLEGIEILNGVDYIYDNLNLDNRTLLISYMGCGEPLLNYKEVVGSMLLLKTSYQDKVSLIRFAVATSIPESVQINFFKLSEAIYRNELPVKIHLSLHYTNDRLRKEWMPNSLAILPSITALEYYQKLTNNSVEIHYALIDNVNDTVEDAELLTRFLKGKNIPVKFLFYNEKPSIGYHASLECKMLKFEEYFYEDNIKFEYYIPPGLDVGASCGQFLMDYYFKYNTKD